MQNGKWSKILIIVALWGVACFLLGAATDHYPLYLIGMAVCLIDLLCGGLLKNRVSGFSLLAVLLVFFLALRLLVPLKYGQLICEDSRNLEALTQYYLGQGHLGFVPASSISPLPLQDAFPGLSAWVLAFHYATGLSIHSIDVFASPFLSLILLSSVAWLSVRLFGIKPEAWYFSALIITIFPAFIYWQMSLLPQTLGLILFILVLLMLAENGDARSRSYTILTLLALGALLVTHHLSMLVLAISLGVAIILESLLRKPFVPNLPLIAIIMLLSYWIFKNYGVMFDLAVKMGNQIWSGLFNPSGLLGMSSFQNSRFPGQPSALILVTLGQILAILIFGIWGILQVFILRKERSAGIVTLISVFLIAGINILVGFFIRGTDLTERISLFGVLSASVFAGWSLSRLANGKNWQKAAAVFIVLLLVLPVPFKLFRFISDPAPQYVYRHIPLEEMDAVTYGRLVYKGESFFSGASFVVEHADDNTPVFGDHSTSRQLLVLDPDLISQVQLYPDSYLPGQSQPSLILLDLRFIDFIQQRESQMYAEDPRLSEAALESHLVVYSASNARVYISR